MGISKNPELNNTPVKVYSENNEEYTMCRYTLMYIIVV